MKRRSVFLLFFLNLLITATAQPLHQIRDTVIDKRLAARMTVKTDGYTPEQTKNRRPDDTTCPV